MLHADGMDYADLLLQVRIQSVINLPFYFYRDLVSLLYFSNFINGYFKLAAEGIPEIGDNEHDTKERRFISEILSISLAICMWCYDCNDLCISSI